MIMSAEKEQGEGEEYFNFTNSLNSESTKKTYAYHLEQFLNFLKSDLHSFLINLQKEKLIIQYLVGDKEQRLTRIERYCQKHFELIINS